jgi:drug/metabolite transporter (DMT)-like permease
MIQPNSQAFKTGLLCAIIGSIAFSGKSIIIKLAYRYGVDAVTLLMFRMLFSLPVFLLLAWWGGRGKAALSKRDWLGVIALAFVGYYLGSYLDFAGLHYITASLGRLIMYLNPTLVLLLGVLFFGKRVRWQQVIAIGVSYSGLCANKRDQQLTVQSTPKHRRKAGSSCCALAAMLRQHWSA